MADPPIAAVIRVEAAPKRPIGGRIHSRDVVWETRFLKLSSLSYSLPSDLDSTTEPTLRKWDAVGRTTRSSSGCGADGVCVLATLRLADGAENNPRVLLVKQFRPPVGAVCVELPAGLIDEGENAADAALRELEEETGFIGTVTHVSRPQSLSPGISAEAICVVEVEVEGTAQNAQVFDDAERIEVVSVPLRRLQEALEHFESEGCVIMHGVGGIAAGVRLGLRHSR
jgi:ADP-ribose pyrophosphatase